MKRAIVLTGLLFALSGCASTNQLPLKTTEATTTTPPTQAIDFDTCEVFVTYTDEYTQFVLDSSSGKVDAKTLSDMGMFIDILQSKASSSIESAVADFSGPYLEIKKAIDGDGNLNFTTNAYKAATVKILDYCANTVHYKKS